MLARVRDFFDERRAAGNDTLVVCHGVINKFLRAAGRGITGAGIIALGEDQETVYRLDGAAETELKANRETMSGCRSVREDREAVRRLDGTAGTGAEWKANREIAT